MTHDGGVAAAKIVIKDFSWFVEIFAPNPANQLFVADQMLWEIPAELIYKERTVFSKRILNDGTWAFELGIQSGKNILSWVIFCFMETKKLDEQIRDISAFDWLPVSSAVCLLGSDIYLDSRMGFDYPSTFFQESFYEIEILFPKHTENRAIKPFIDINSIRRIYFFKVFGIRNQKPILQHNQLV